MEGIKIFYSWQSDLPGNNNKYLIQDAIKSATALLKETITVIPDRDTNGMTGSPNIEETIFNKIKNCDLFVADISFVAKYKNTDGKEKQTPNPNVLIELGYAVRVLGWENVICFFNEDYGRVDDLPFDLNHHRVTGYSVNSSTKSDARKMIRDIVASTVMTLVERGIRPKEGFASHILGGYDEVSKEVIKELIPHKISDSETVKNRFAKMREIINKKIEEVNSITLPQPIEVSSEKDNELLERISIPDVKLELFKYKAAVIREEDKTYICQYANEQGINLNNTFFDLGDLEVSLNSYPMIGDSRRGSDAAKEKYDKIHDLLSAILRMDMYQMYLMTFEGMFFFPLAIWNNTQVTDEDLNIAVIVDEQSAEVVVPDENLIEDAIKDFAGDIYESGMIKKLFRMPDTTDIFDGSDYEPTISAEVRKQIAANVTIDPFGYSREPSYDIEDYVDEIQKYIANPIEGCKNEFDFHISKLQSNEKNWLGKGLLLKPIGDEIRVFYRIRSDSTMGNIQGELRYKVDK